MSFSLETMLHALKVASVYIPTTLFIAFVSLFIGGIFGLLIALVRLYNIKILSSIFKFIITILKGIPIVLIILGTFLLSSQFFNPLAKSLGWRITFKDVNMITIAVLALSIMATIQLSEIFRGTLASIKKGQYDAAKSIGLTTFQTIRRILIPLAFPVALPMISNLLINLIKASSLASMVAVVDIFAAAKISANQNYRFLEAYVAVAIIYWALNFLIEKSSNFLENSLNRKLRRSFQ